MNSSTAALCVAYALYIGGPVFKDELRMRVTLALGSVAFVVWGTLIEQDGRVVIGANLLFIAISVRPLMRLVRSRLPVDLSPVQRTIKETVFPSMTPREFLLFWHLSDEEQVQTAPILERGEVSDRLFLMTHGQAEVTLLEKSKRLSAPQLLGEVSFVQGADAPATATVEAIGPVTLRSWKTSTLRALGESHPHLTVPFLTDISRGVASRVDS